MPYQNLESTIRGYSLIAVGTGLVLLSLLIVISLLMKKQSSFVKKLLFSTIVFAVLLPTLFLAASTIYLNTVSVSQGPVHYHADLEIFNCATKVNLRDPEGLSNKIGAATLHEHNDKRIHLEGVVLSHEDASLGRFFEVIGGKLSQHVLTLPTNNGTLTLHTGSYCPDGEPALLQTFVYSVKNGIYSQKKVSNPQQYIISPESNIPPGDCVIIELSYEKDQTDKLCQSYKIAEQIGKIKKGTNILSSPNHIESM